MRTNDKLDLIRYHLAQCDPASVDVVHLKKALEEVLKILDQKANVVTHQHYYPDSYSEFG